ncbi:MAG: winged helix-turn-helix domain-containing protein [Deltaproteobacteria bacterium]|jgi:Arc/MetJ-type ribon-helix-helix transcriptional regulator
MISPKTPEQLARAIEALVDAGRRAASEAIDRSFVSRSGRRPRVGGNRAPATERAPGRRRSAEEIEALAEQLYALVRANAGESMATFAEQLRARATDLHRPMMKLKAEGRVRSVGQRHQTRYFPAVGRRPRET